MLKLFRGKRGQGISAEYAVSLVVGVAAVAMMFTFIKRTFQARALDAQKQAITQAAQVLAKPIAMEYEPYYSVSATKTDAYKEERTRIAFGGLFNKEIQDDKGIGAASRQLSPREVQ